MSDDEKMGFAEWVGRIVLFPLSWIDQAATKKRENANRERERQAEAERRRIADERHKEERQRLAEQSAEKERLEAEKAEHLSRGEKARYRCQLLYDQYEYKIREKFPQEKLERYFEQYMNDDFSVDLIERRGQDLEVMIKGFVGEEKPKKPKSRTEIKAFFDKERADAKAAGLAPEILEATMVEINYREDQAMMDYLDNA